MLQRGSNITLKVSWDKRREIYYFTSSQQTAMHCKKNYVSKLEKTTASLIHVEGK